MSQFADYLFHGSNLMVFLAVAYHVIKRLNRDETLKQDYPPHRHINGTKIVYPKEYQPGEVENWGKQ